jgi:hypothetical protein
MDNFVESWSDPRLPDRRDLHPAINQATETLRVMVGTNRDPSMIHACWSLVPNPIGGREIELRLADTTAQVIEHFRADDLTGADAWFLLSRVYRRLLGERIRLRHGTIRASELPPAGVC